MRRLLAAAIVCLISAFVVEPFLMESVFADTPKLDGLTIKQIRINNQNVFSLSDDRENGFFYQSANFLHIRTRNHIIKAQLLFKEGDTYLTRLANESERILRANNYIREATITADEEDGEVVINITTFDTWSTKPTVSFGRVGGKNKTEIGLEEANLLGLGVNLGLSYRKDFDRTSTTVQLVDKQLFNSWYRLAVTYSDTSDGFLNDVSVDKPFYSLDATTSQGFSVRREKKTDSLYFKGQKYLMLDKEDEELDVYTGWSNGLSEGSLIRHSVGLHSLKQRATSAIEQPIIIDEQVSAYLNNLDTDIIRDEIYPYYAFDFLQDRFDKTINQDKIARTEDRYIGSKYGFKVGFVNDIFGANDNFLKLEGYLGKHLQLSKDVFVSTGASVDFELPNSGTAARNLMVEYYLKTYINQSGAFKFYADFIGNQSQDLRLDRQLFMGEQAGFRGYPLRYLSGDRFHKLTLEQRYFSDKDLWRLFNFGAAVFFDIGKISGGSQFERSQNGVYKSVGIGLRITSNRSSRGDIIHIDLSSPLNAKEDVGDLQFSIKTKTVF